MRGYVPLLLAVAAIWGASYMFIEVALRELEPTFLMDVRLLGAAAVLVPLLVVRLGRSGLARLRASWRDVTVMGILNGALPFTLIAWGQEHVDSGVAAIANASTPIFVVLLAIRFRSSERVTGSRLFGILLGLVGVAVLAGVDPKGGWWAAAGTLAVVGASFSYAAVLHAQHAMDETGGLVLAAGAMLAGGLVLLPFAAFQTPSDVPSLKAVGALAALAFGGTAIGFLLYLRMVRRYGAARSSLVTYLMPLTALLYGSLLLDEPLRLPALAGLALILGGVALGSGVARPVRRAAAPAPVP